MNGKKLYEVRNVCYRYERNGHSVQALCGLDLDVSPGEFVAIAGPSGSGKTTLLNILGLLDRPEKGTVQFEGADVSGLSERERTLLRRRRIGFVFQNLNLIPVLTVQESVEYFLLKGKTPAEEVHWRVADALEAVGLTAQAKARVNTLSGGECQRVAVARALVRNVDVVLGDEPTAALDHATGLLVMQLMRKLNAERGVTFVFSSHDPSILACANRLVSLADGKLAL